VASGVSIASAAFDDVGTACLSVNQAARRQRIVDAALALLDRRDYEHIHVREVAEEASVALGTVYHYFESKEHLFSEVLVHRAATLRSSITRSPLVGHSPADRLLDALRRTVGEFERRPQIGKLVARLAASGDPGAAVVLNRIHDATSQVYLGVLTDMDAAVAARIIRVVEAVLDSGLRAWSGGRLPVSEVYRMLEDAVELLVPTSTNTGMTSTSTSTS
jgi:TetR/AcrR family transcriptional regulator, cholesterol catabolism regulator